MSSKAIQIEEPRFARFLFSAPGSAGIWLVVRVWLGYQWLHAGWEKITGTGGGTFSWKFGFTGDSWLRTGAGLKGFVGFALKGAGSEHASVNYGWYAAFLRWIERSGAGFMAPAIAIGETLIGLALIFGLFTAVAAFFGGDARAAAARTELMAQICAARSSRFTITAQDFAGTPVGIDARLVAELEVAPQISTGVLHASAGAGQIGAGVAHQPLEPFQAAVAALVEALDA